MLSMRRGAIPPGKAGLVVLAAAAIPVVIGAAKPFARAIGRGLTKIGDKLQEAAAEAKNGSAVKPEPPKAEPAKTEAKAPEAEVTVAVAEGQIAAEAAVAEPEKPPVVEKPAKKAKLKVAPKAAKTAKKKEPAVKGARKRPPTPDDFETA